MLVNIECSCGQPYEFEVEPVDGQMPVEVRCPTCGADGTELANAFIARELSKPEAALSTASASDASPISLNPTSSALPAGASPSPGSSPLRAGRSHTNQASLLSGMLGAVGGGLLGMMG
jgi:hypothetical protein